MEISTSLIVAVTQNSCIGLSQGLPWTQRNDMTFFKNTTINRAVIMGRKTFETLKGKPLPKRLNIVVSRTLTNDIEGVKVVKDLPSAIKFSRKKNFLPIIIGGGVLYEEAVNLVDYIYITALRTEIDGDTFFPKLDYHSWYHEIVEVGEADDKNDYAYTIYKLTRKLNTNGKII